MTLFSESLDLIMSMLGEDELMDHVYEMEIEETSTEVIYLLIICFHKKGTPTQNYQKIP